MYFGAAECIEIGSGVCLADVCCEGAAGLAIGVESESVDLRIGSQSWIVSDWSGIDWSATLPPSYETGSEQFSSGRITWQNGRWNGKSFCLQEAIEFWHELLEVTEDEEATI